MSRAVEIISRGVCLKAGKVLLCHSKGASNTYLPGGHVEFGEGARESLRREIDEELGVACHVGRFLGAVEHTFRQKGRRVCEVNLVFEFSSRALSPRMAPASEESHIEFLWAAPADLAVSALEPAPLRRLLPRWIASRATAECFASTYC